jgi:hypothetical protein
MHCEVLEYGRRSVVLTRSSSSAWKKQAHLRYRLSPQKGYLDNENIIISQSL